MITSSSSRRLSVNWNLASESISGHQKLNRTSMSDSKNTVFSHFVSCRSEDFSYKLSMKGGITRGSKKDRPILKGAAQRKKYNAGSVG